MTDTLTTRPRSTPIQALDAAVCWALLRSENLGRLAVVGPDGVDVFPVNYLVDGTTVVFRSAPGTKLADLALRDLVAFEVDGSDVHHRWSVVLRGHARRLDADDEIEATGVLGLRPESGVTADNYVRISPTTVSGRRFRWAG